MNNQYKEILAQKEAKISELHSVIAKKNLKIDELTLRLNESGSFQKGRARLHTDFFDGEIFIISDNNRFIEYTVSDGKHFVLNKSEIKSVRYLESVEE